MPANVLGTTRMAAADGLRSVATLEPDASHAPRLKVFVSYSRADTAFADEIVAGLEYDGGFEVFIDRHSIHEGEAWRDRLSGLIASADIIVFLLTKSSAKSDLCRWEAEHAKGLSKRLVPVLVETVDGEAAPTTLSALHYVRFDEGRSFMQGLAALRSALRADFAWVQEHTRLLMRAQEWDAAGRSENRLLSGADIVAAKAWLEHRPADAPPPLELHHAYIAASEQAETARLSEDRQQAEALKNALVRSKRALMATVVVGLIAAAAGLAAGVLYYQTRDIGARAERAVFERDMFIREAETRELQLTQQIAALDAERARLSALVANPPVGSNGPTASTDVTAEDVDLAPLNQRVSELLANLQGLAAKRGDSKWVAPVRPSQDAGQSSKAYAQELEAYLADLERQYLTMLKSPPPQRQRVLEPYNPSIVKQQAIMPSPQPLN